MFNLVLDVLSRDAQKIKSKCRFFENEILVKESREELNYKHELWR